MSRKLLISVRDAEEASAAISAGADLIDVKEPSRGALGMAHHETVAAVVSAVKKRAPVSAALGEWSPRILTDSHWHLELKLDYVKWGLAGYQGGGSWGEDLLETKRALPSGVEAVCVAYADWEKAASMPAAEVARFAKRFRFRAFLLDTFDKDGGTILDHMKAETIAEIIDSLRRGGTIVALGGGLKPEQLKHLKSVTPDFFAVRSSVCVGGKRDAVIDPARVRKWKELLV